MHDTTSVDCQSDPAGVPVRFDTRVVVALRDDLLPWQELNVTAFLMSGIAIRSGLRPQRSDNEEITNAPTVAEMPSVPINQLAVCGSYLRTCVR